MCSLPCARPARNGAWSQWKSILPAVVAAVVCGGEHQEVVHAVVEGIAIAMVDHAVVADRDPAQFCEPVPGPVPGVALTGIPRQGVVAGMLEPVLAPGHSPASRA